MAATHDEQQTPVIYYQDLHKTSCIQMAGCFAKAHRPDPLSNISGMKRLAKRARQTGNRMFLKRPILPITALCTA